MKKHICLILSIIIAASFLSGCTKKDNVITTINSGDIKKVNANVTDSNLKFAFNIFKQINKEDKDENVFISPFSISSALTMTYNGARESTAQNMSKALSYEGISLNKINESYKNLIGHLNNYSDVELNIANSIWVRKGEAINPKFLSENREMFGAFAKELDFKKEDAAATINQWISDATKKKIEKMIDPPITVDVIMYLINAIYFKGQWAEQFDKNNTLDAKFHMEDGNELDIKMMSRKDEVKYGAGDDFKVVKLPYGNEKTSMYCILPEQYIKINDFINDMTVEKWKIIKKSVKKTYEVLVQIPKFKMEYGIKSLKDGLTAMGMGEAFNKTADFSGIRKNIYISDVIHKAIIEVNEEGSEAAGVTVGVLKTTSAVTNPITFVADRPMIFMIVDEDSNTILFMGKLFDVR